MDDAKSSEIGDFEDFEIEVDGVVKVNGKPFIKGVMFKVRPEEGLGRLHLTYVEEDSDDLQIDLAISYRSTCSLMSLSANVDLVVREMRSGTLFRFNVAHKVRNKETHVKGTVESGTYKQMYDRKVQNPMEILALIKDELYPIISV